VLLGLLYTLFLIIFIKSLTAFTVIFKFSVRVFPATDAVPRILAIKAFF
jgi:hypothetical protein